MRLPPNRLCRRLPWPRRVSKLSDAGYGIALQLACALAANDVLAMPSAALTFVSADDGLLAAASAEGLQMRGSQLPLTFAMECVANVQPPQYVQP